METVVFAVVALGIGWFYCWSARTEDSTWKFGQQQTDYYNLLVDGMLEGHVSLKADVPPELLRIADPYNPANRPPGVGLHDASLYHGKYYLYFGVAPVVTLMLPFRLLTHTALPLPAAVVIFAYAGFLVSAATWWLVRRRYFPAAGTVLSAGMLLALGLANTIPVVARRANIWELPLSSGYFFCAVAVLCVLQTIRVRRGGWTWLAGASLALGLAVASRPTYLYATGLLVIPWIWRWQQGVREGKRAAWLTNAVVAFGPLIAVGCGVALYNYCRFGNPLEFGVAYQFSGIYEATSRHFSFRYLPYDFGLYGFAPIEWSRYFPFIHPGKLPAPPPGHFGHEEVCGILLNLPVVWLALLAPIAIWQRSPDERSRLRVWIGATALGLGGVVTTLAFFYAVVGRYEADFVPTTVLLATVATLGVERWAVRRARRIRVFGGLLLGATMAYSAVFGVLFSLRLYGQFQRSSPHGFATLARICDYPAYWVEKANGTTFGPVEMKIRFPAASKEGRREPLLHTGWYQNADHIFIEQVSADQIRIGYAHDSGARELSHGLAVLPQSTHQVRIEMGSLYPPEESPWFADWTGDREHDLTRRLRVTFDGAMVLDCYQRFYVGAGGSFRVGEESDTTEFGTQFTGVIVSVTRDPVRLQPAPKPREQAISVPSQFTTMEMNVVLPLRRPIRTHEPIITTGQTGGADFLYVDYVDATHVRFGLEHWGKPAIFSPLFEWPGGQARHFEVHLGSFPGGSNRPPDDRVVIRIDGILRWSSSARFYRSEAPDVFVATNPLGGTACGARFTGEISEVQHHVTASTDGAEEDSSHEP